MTNKGPDAAVNTRVTDKLPAGLIYITSSGNYDPVTGLWIVGDLANGESKKLVIYTQVNITNATIVNVANVTTDTPGITPPPVNMLKRFLRSLLRLVRLLLGLLL